MICRSRSFNRIIAGHAASRTILVISAVLPRRLSQLVCIIGTWWLIERTFSNLVLHFPLLYIGISAPNGVRVPVFSSQITKFPLDLRPTSFLPHWPDTIDHCHEYPVLFCGEVRALRPGWWKRSFVETVPWCWHERPIRGLFSSVTR